MVPVVPTRSSLCTALVTGVLVAGLAAPALGQSREQQETIAELRMLQEQTQRLQQTVNALADEVKQLKDQVAAENGHIDTQANQQLKTTADLRDIIANLGRTVSTLEERIGENNIRVQQIDQEIAPIRSGLTQLTTALNEALQQLSPAAGTAGEGAAGAPGTPGASPPATPGLTVPPSPNDTLSQAKGFYMQGQFDLALSGFRDFLQQFPGSASACEAQYYIGETHRSQKKYTEAVQDYDVVINKYKGCDMVGSAYYEQGFAYEQLKEPQKAIANYKQIHVIAAEKPSEAWQNADALAQQALARLSGKG